MLWLSLPAISIIPQYLLLNKRNYVNSENSIQSVKEPYHIIHGSCIMCTFSDELTSLESSDASNATPYQKYATPLVYLRPPGQFYLRSPRNTSSEHENVRSFSFLSEKHAFYGQKCFFAERVETLDP